MIMIMSEAEPNLDQSPSADGGQITRVERKELHPAPGVPRQLFRTQHTPFQIGPSHQFSGKFGRHYFSRILLEWVQAHLIEAFLYTG